MTHQPVAPGPVPEAGQAPYPAHPAPRTGDEQDGPTNGGADRTTTVRQASAVTREGGASRIWLAAAATGVCLAVAAALIPLLRRPERPKHPKKKAHRRQK